MNIFELTLQRRSKTGWPIVVERKQPDVLLPIRHEGSFQFTPSDFDELHSRLGQPEAYGRYLGEKLFQGEVRAAFDQACGESPDGLRVLLFIEADCTELRTLRWERLCAPKEGHWDLLRLDQRLPFSLYIPSSTDRRFPPIGKRNLRALVVAASPANLGKYRLDAFDVEASVAGVREALGDIPCDVLAPLADAIGPPTLDELCRQLTDRSKQYTLLHFISHGKVLPDGDTVLYWANVNNQAEVITGEQLIQRMRRLQGPRGLPHFAFLSTCESASPEAEGALGGLGQRLVRDLGMPAVIAMTEKVTVTTALALGQRFYHQLRESGYVDLALDEATAGLAGRYDVTVPALFSRLAGQPLFSDSLDRPLTNAEIQYGLERLQTLLAERAPILQSELDRPVQVLQGTLAADTTALSVTMRQERDEALFEINTLCDEVTDLSFNALALGDNPPTYEARCPFLGLYPFRAQDREFFFGREGLIKKLHQALTEHRFLAVLGPSGSGKSSVVLAGVIPDMQAQSPELQMAYLTPSSEPMAQLTTAQEPVSNQAAVFVVDQFEELFTLCAQEEQRQAFIDQLLSLNQPVVITMRADFWGECAPYEALKAQMTARQFLIAPMNTAELRGAMEQQAAKVGLRFEADLSNAILDEVKEEPGAMPLLQHGLQELWKRRHGRWLKVSEYREGIGGIKQAIAKTADAVYHRLSPAEQTQFQNIFIRLTRLDESALQGEGHRDTRRRVGLEELVPAGGELSATKRLVKHLADARLVVTSVNSVTHREEVEVAHEALIRYWPRLANWLDENRTNLQLRETIRQAALTWEENQRQEDFLVHKGVRLEDAKGLARQTGFLNQLEADYVEACAALAEAVERAISKRRKITWASLSAGIIIAIGLAIFSWLQMIEAKNAKIEAEKSEINAKKQAENAKKQRNEALKTQSLFLADLSRQQIDKSTVNGMLLALEGLPKKMSKPDRPHVAEAEEALYQAVVTHSELIMSKHRVLEGENSISHLAFSPDGKTIVTSEKEGWVQLWDATHGQLLHTLIGHEDSVKHAAFSPDGSLLATASWDKTVRLWEVSSGKPLQIFLGHTNWVNHATFSPDGSILATASWDNTARLWEVASGKLLQTLTGHSDTVYHVAFSPDGSLLATASWDNTARMWKVASGKLLQTLTGHESSVNHTTFSSNGSLLVTASWDNTARLWEVASGKTLQTLTGHGSSVNYATFNSDGSLLATVSSDNTARLWKVASGKLLQTLTGHDSYVNHASFSVDDSMLATAGMDNTARLWEVSSGELLQTLEHETFVSHAIFSPNSSKLQLATVSDNTVHMWEVPSRFEPLQTLTKHEDSVTQVIFSPDSSKLATSSGNIVYLWEVSSGELLHRFSGHSLINHITFNPNGSMLSAVSSSVAYRWEVSSSKLLQQFHTEHEWNDAVFSPNGSNLATFHREAYGKTTIRLWKVTNDQLFLLHTRTVNESFHHAVFSPDGSKFAISLYNTVLLHEVVSGELLHTFFTTTTDERPWYAVFSPDGSKLAITSYSKNTSLWEVTSGKLLHTFPANKWPSHAVFNPAGSLLTVLYGNNKVRLWEVSSGKLLRTLTKHKNPTHRAAFSPDGSKLATASGDGTANLWWVSSGKPLQTLTGHDGPVNHVVFSPDGSLLATASSDDGTGIVRLWRIFSTQELIDYANQTVPHCLTPKQRQQFFLSESPSEEALVSGKISASKDQIKEAVVQFESAKQSAPCFQFDPSDKARRIAAQAQIKTGKSLMKEDKIDEVVAAFNHAIEIDSRFNGLLLMANYWMAKGDQLAKRGKIAEAVAQFNQVKKWVPSSSFHFDLENRAKQFSVLELLKQGRELAEKGEIEAAFVQYQKAQQRNPHLKVSVLDWSTLCWYGNLYGHAVEVREACEKAVKLMPENIWVRRNRGVARALTGNTQGAIEDLRFFVERTKYKRSQVQGWIETLLQSKNPFTETVLKTLREVPRIDE